MPTLEILIIVALSVGLILPVVFEGFGHWAWDWLVKRERISNGQKIGALLFVGLAAVSATGVRNAIPASRIP